MEEMKYDALDIPVRSAPRLPFFKSNTSPKSENIQVSNTETDAEIELVAVPDQSKVHHRMIKRFCTLLQKQGVYKFDGFFKEQLSNGFELLPLWQLDYLATPGGITP